MKVSSRLNVKHYARKGTEVFLNTTVILPHMMVSMSYIILLETGSIKAKVR